jgi:hypothetical protein
MEYGTLFGETFIVQGVQAHGEPKTSSGRIPVKERAFIVGVSVLPLT